MTRVPEMAATVLAQAPPRFALAGHSLGAIVALEILRQAPSRVSRVMLVNASGRGPSEAQRDAWRSWRERTVGGQFERIAQELALDTLPAARRADTQLVRASAAMAFEVGADGFLRQLSGSDESTGQPRKPGQHHSAGSRGVRCAGRGLSGSTAAGDRRSLPDGRTQVDRRRGAHGAPRGAGRTCRSGAKLARQRHGGLGT